MKIPLYTVPAGVTLHSIQKKETPVIVYRRKRKSPIKKRSNPRAATRKRKSPARKRPVARKRSAARVSRPRLRYTKKGWVSSSRDPLELRGKRINPKRRRRVRRNPKLDVKSFKDVVIKSLPVGTGIALGFIGMPALYRVLPEDVTSQASFPKWRGLIHVALGSIVFIFGKKQAIKTVGVTVAGTGVYDLIAANTQESIGLPMLPTANKLFSDNSPSISAPVGAYYGASYQAAGTPVSPVSRAGIGASYEGAKRLAGLPNVLGESYHTGMDNDIVNMMGDLDF